MTQYLPPNLLALFAARDPIRYLPPPTKLVVDKKTDGYSGVSEYLDCFEDPKETPAPTRGEKKEERIARKQKERAEIAAARVAADRAQWDPSQIPSATTDAFKTLFVGRMLSCTCFFTHSKDSLIASVVPGENYDTSESKLRREFEHYGPIKMIHMVHRKLTGKPRGYAFIEYEKERDMHDAYKHADGKKIDSRRVLVDVERARTVKGWFPRRLGGGLGGTRRGGPEVNTRHSGREDQSGSLGRADDDWRDRRRDDRRRRSRSRDRSRRDRDRDRDRSRRDGRDRRDRDRDRDSRRRRDYRYRGDYDEDRKPTAEELEEYERMRIKEEREDVPIRPKEEPRDYEMGQLPETNGGA